MKLNDIVLGEVYAYKRRSYSTALPVRVIDTQKFRESSYSARMLVSPQGQHIRALEVISARKDGGEIESVPRADMEPVLRSVDYGGLLADEQAPQLQQPYGGKIYNVRVTFVRLAGLLMSWTAQVAAEQAARVAKEAYEAKQEQARQADVARKAALRAALEKELGVSLADAGWLGFEGKMPYDVVKTSFDADKLLAALRRRGVVSLEAAARATKLTADEISALLNDDTNAWVLDDDKNVLGITQSALAWLQSGEWAVNPV